MSVKVPFPSVVPTPFSKKQPPPNESPTSVTFAAASLKPATTTVPTWPFQSDHSAGSTLAVRVNVPLVRTWDAGIDHQ